MVIQLFRKLLREDCGDGLGTKVDSGLEGLVAGSSASVSIDPTRPFPNQSVPVVETRCLLAVM